MIDKELFEKRELTPDERLLAAVIEQTIKDGCERPYYFKKKEDRKTKKVEKVFTMNQRRISAREWFNQPDSTLKRFCRILDLNTAYVRKLANQLFDEYDAQHLPA